MGMRKTPAELLFDVFNYGLFVLLGTVTLYPLLSVVAISLSDYAAFIEHPLMIIPRQLNLNAYSRILTSPVILTSYVNSAYVTVVGTLVNILLTVTLSYPLAKSKVRGARIVMFFLVFTMFFDGGLVPTYLVVRGLGLLNTRLALFVPTAVAMFCVLITRNYLAGIPDSLEEAATIDGAGHLYILTHVIVPLAKPVIATIALYYAVWNWNRFFEVIIYVQDRAKQTLQVLLREIVSENQDILNAVDPSEMLRVYPKMVQAATIVVTVLPILLVYPFVQKYFIKGILLGAIKE